MDEEQTSKQAIVSLEDFGIKEGEEETPEPERQQYAAILLTNGMTLNQVEVEEITPVGVIVRGSLVIKPKNPREKAREIVTTRIIPWPAILMFDLIPDPASEVLA